MRFIIIMLLVFSYANSQMLSMKNSIHSFTVEDIDGNKFSLSSLKGKKIMIVNTASKCGLTPQYKKLEALYKQFREKNFVIVGFPSNNFGKQEPGSNKDIKDFCETNFNISFPMTEKMDVIGRNAHPFFKWAKENHGRSAIPKWNFHKIIIGKNGRVSGTFTSITKPSSDRFINLIEKEIKN